MSPIRIKATSRDLTVNDRVFDSAPSIQDLCEALGSREIADGFDVVIGRRAVYRFRYFDDVGVGILQSIATARVVNVDFYLEVPPLKNKSSSPYSGRDLPAKRRTSSAFQGLIELNGLELRSPLSLDRFPCTGDLNFVNRIALGTNISAFVSVQSTLIERIGFGFKRKDDD